MSTPEIIKESLQFLKIMTDNNIDEVALLNVLNAKFTQLVSLKNIGFKQFNNTNKKTLSYYGINFMPSGRQKDYTVSCINDYLLPFIKDKYNERIENYKKEYKDEQYYLRRSESKKEAAKINAEIEEELKRIRPANLEIEDGNMFGLYEEAKQIKRINFGSLFIKISELGDYIDGITSGNLDKKDFFQNLKNIYEGNIAGRIIKSEARENISGVSVQALMYADFESLLDNRNNKYFKNMLKTGFGRRSFVYIPIKNEILKMPIKHEMKQDAVDNAIRLRNRIETEIFNKIREDAEFYYSEEAQEKIFEYRCECVEKTNKMGDYDDILATDLRESYWKIQKLAVVYSILENPGCSIVAKKYIEMAIDFYQSISPCLEVVLEKKESLPIDNLIKYIKRNMGRVITKTDLRRQNFVNQNQFKRWLEESLIEASNILREENIFVCEYTGDKNSQKYQIIKKEIENATR